MPLPKSDWNVVTPTKQSVTSLFVVLRSTAIALLVPLFIFQGMQQAVLFSEFTRVSAYFYYTSLDAVQCVSFTYSSLKIFF